MPKTGKKKRQGKKRVIETALPKKQYKHINRLFYVFSGILLVVFGGGAALLGLGARGGGPAPTQTPAVVSTVTGSPADQTPAATPGTAAAGAAATPTPTAGTATTPAPATGGSAATSVPKAASTTAPSNAAAPTPPTAPTAKP